MSLECWHPACEARTPKRKAGRGKSKSQLPNHQGWQEKKRQEAGGATAQRAGYSHTVNIPPETWVAGTETQGGVISEVLT